MRPRLTYSNVVSTLCLFLLLGGGAAYAASHLGKNSVGSKQLKKNAVTTAKIKKEAITAAKVKKGALTGSQIKASTLGTVPTAGFADSAGTANTAAVASSIAPPEAWHVVGAPGEPRFLNGWENVGDEGEAAAFYKDREGIVHLRGFVNGGSERFVFVLPPGSRPASGKTLDFTVACYGLPGCPNSLNAASVTGPGFPESADREGVVSIPYGANVSLDGITFRAES
jgi:hypothetical protein